MNNRPIKQTRLAPPPPARPVATARNVVQWGKHTEENMFEDEFSELQADMVDICNEYSKGLADKIFIYAASEGLIFAHHFYCINNKIFDCHKLNEAGLQTEFDVSTDCQGQVLDILNEDIKKILSLCKKYSQPTPKLMKLVYEPKTKKFNAEYKYENQTTDDVSVFDNDEAWFEKEKAKLADKGTDTPPDL